MFDGCTSLKLSTTKTGNYTKVYRIPTTGTGTTATDALADMFYNTGGTFTGTPSLNTIYYVPWNTGYYEITLNLNGKTATNSPTTVIYNKYGTGYYTDSAFTTQMTTSANGITVPTATGYTFAGYAASGGTQYIGANGKLTSSASTTFFNTSGTLYAHWTVNTYTVTATAKYSSVSGTYSGATIGTTGGTVSGGGSGDYGTTKTLTASAATGYNFVGWYNSSGTQVSTSTSYSPTILGAATYYAYFRYGYYSISITVEISGLVSPVSNIQIDGSTGYDDGGFFGVIVPVGRTATITGTLAAKKALQQGTKVTIKRGSTVLYQYLNTANNTYNFNYTYSPIEGDHITMTFERTNS